MVTPSPVFVYSLTLVASYCFKFWFLYNQLQCVSYIYIYGWLMRDWHYYPYHPTMQYRWLRGDLIFLHKVLNNYSDTDFTDLYTYSTTTTTIGGISLNCLRSVQDYYVARSNYFINRIIKLSVHILIFHNLWLRTATQLWFSLFVITCSLT